MRSTLCPCLLMLLLSLPGCTQATMAAQSQAGQSFVLARAAPPTATKAALPSACPDADFASFLKCFEGSVDVQRTATADPLKMDSIQAAADPEPRPVTRQVPLRDVEFPIMPDGQERHSKEFEQIVSELGPARREVTHRIPDTGAQLRFEFRADPCWELVRVSNDMI